MTAGQITARIADVIEELKRLERGIDRVPEATTVRRTQGAAVGPAYSFNRELTLTAAAAAEAARRVVNELEAMDAAVRASVKELVEFDTAALDSSQRTQALEALESIDDVTVDQDSSQSSKTGFRG